MSRLRSSPSSLSKAATAQRSASAPDDAAPRQVPPIAPEGRPLLLLVGLGNHRRHRHRAALLVDRDEGGREALEAAIADYRGMILPMAEGEMVCECFGVTDLEIIRAINESHLRSVEEITNFTKAGGGCGKCEDKLRLILQQTVSGGKVELLKPLAKPKRMTTLQKIKKIEEVLEREIRPGLRKDGGDIELIDVDGDFVSVSLRGACKSCAKSQTTIKEYVEKKLRELVLESLIVEENN